MPEAKASRPPVRLAFGASGGGDRRAALQEEAQAPRLLTMPRNGNTTQRGYGSAHQALRARIAGQVKAGAAVCWRCGQLIQPGQPWDLGHTEGDRGSYAGPEHRWCNRAAGARNANQARRARRRLANPATATPTMKPVTSRNWW